MKKLFSLSFLLLMSLAYTQIPTGYYNNATGTGATLKSNLKTIISNGHQDQGYVWTVINACDRDLYYENNNTILDIYSEKPTTTDAYEFTVTSDQCGNYSGEGNCYNREHTVPQGFFNSNAPMVSDYHHICATDGYVNGKRSNYPYGKVGTATWTSTNGSKLGNSVSPGYSGTVFEPIDEFKGDIARMQLYFITRYENELPTFNYTDANNPMDGSKFPGFEQWYINVLLLWHNQDPVSAREINRNNCVYGKQGNRNPYVDHPEYVNMIWTSTLAVDQITAPKNAFKVYPNPVKNGNLFIISDDKNAQKAQIFTLDGKLVKTISVTNSGAKTIDVSGISKGVYLIEINKYTQKLIIE